MNQKPSANQPAPASESPSTETILLASSTTGPAIEHPQAESALPPEEAHAQSLPTQEEVDAAEKAVSESAEADKAEVARLEAERVEAEKAAAIKKQIVDSAIELLRNILPTAAATPSDETSAMLRYHVELRLGDTEKPLVIAGQHDFSGLLLSEARPEAVDVLGAALHSSIVRPLILRFTSHLAKHVVTDALLTDGPL